MPGRTPTYTLELLENWACPMHAVTPAPSAGPGTEQVLDGQCPE